jgi:hypothetical protein
MILTLHTRAYAREFVVRRRIVEIASSDLSRLAYTSGKSCILIGDFICSFFDFAMPDRQTEGVP